MRELLLAMARFAHPVDLPSSCPDNSHPDPDHYQLGSSQCTVWSPDGSDHFVCDIDNTFAGVSIGCHR